MESLLAWEMLGFCDGEVFESIFLSTWSDKEWFEVSILEIPFPTWLDNWDAALFDLVAKKIFPLLCLKPGVEVVRQKNDACCVGL